MINLRELLLFGDAQLNVASNRNILEAAISFIKNTKRFPIVAIMCYSNFFKSFLLITQSGFLKGVLLFISGQSLFFSTFPLVVKHIQQ